MQNNLHSIKTVMRRHSVRLFALASAVVALAVVAPIASASTGDLYLTTNVTLSEDHHGQIIINADNVTLDCGDHEIIGAGFNLATNTGDFAGVSFRSHTGITVKNCHASNFKVGFIIWQSSGNTLTNNTSSGNASEGFVLADSSNNNTLSGNTASGNDGEGSHSTEEPRTTPSQATRRATTRTRATSWQAHPTPTL